MHYLISETLERPSGESFVHVAERSRFRLQPNMTLGCSRHPFCRYRGPKGKEVACRGGGQPSCGHLFGHGGNSAMPGFETPQYLPAAITGERRGDGSCKRRYGQKKRKFTSAGTWARASLDPLGAHYWQEYQVDRTVEIGPSPMCSQSRLSCSTVLLVAWTSQQQHDGSSWSTLKDRCSSRTWLHQLWPGMVLLSGTAKQVVLLELTIAWEDRLEEEPNWNTTRHASLGAEYQRQGWRGRCLACESSFAEQSLNWVLGLLVIYEH